MIKPRTAKLNSERAQGAAKKRAAMLARLPEVFSPADYKALTNDVDTVVWAQIGMMVKCGEVEVVQPRTTPRNYRKVIS